MKKIVSAFLTTSLLLSLLPLSLNATAQVEGVAQVQYQQTLSETSRDICFIVDSKGGVKQNKGFIEEEIDLVIPSVVGESDVSSIQMQGFYGLTEVQSIAIPSSVSIIGDEAFAECSSLEYVMIPTSVVSIGADIVKNTEAVLFVYEGSYAETYCVEQGLNFRVLEYAAVEPTPEDNNGNDVEEETPDTYVDPESEGFVMPENGNLAYPSTAKMEIDGKAVDLAAYNIDGFNYFRLTDLAYALTGTTSQYNVVWDADKMAINIVTRAAYSVQGDEFQANSGRTEVALPFVSDTYIDGEVNPITVFIIDGKSYFQLNHLSIYLDFSLGWNATTSTISLMTPESQGDPVLAYLALVERAYNQSQGKIYLVLDFDKVTNMTEEEKEKVESLMTSRVPSTVTVVGATEEELKTQGMMTVTTYMGFVLQEFSLGTLLTFENVEMFEGGFQCKVGTYHSHVKTEYQNYVATWNGEEFVITTV